MIIKAAKEGQSVVRCSALQCVENDLYAPIGSTESAGCSVLQCVAVRCSLQCVDNDLSARVGSAERACCSVLLCCSVL